MLRKYAKSDPWPRSIARRCLIFALEWRVIFLVQMPLGILNLPVAIGLPKFPSIGVFRVRVATEASVFGVPDLTRV
jgi:hypothetical protein